MSDSGQTGTRDTDLRPLATLLDGMQRIGLDVSVNGMLDAIWLALQPGFALSAPKPEADRKKPTTESQLPRGPETGQKAAEDKASEEGYQTSIGTASIDKHKQASQVPEVSDKQGVYAATAAEGVKMTLPASPLRIPAAAALEHKLPLTRSLRPLRRAFRNTKVLEIDEEATAEAMADARDTLMPVLRPRLERWYELILVTDSVPSMDVWFETIREFEEVTRTAGAFRDIRHYRLEWKATASAPKVGTPVLLNPDGVPFPAVSLAQTNVRRLIFIATNGSATHWTDGRMAELISVWSSYCSIAITQMLPERLWSHVQLGEPELSLSTHSPGASASMLDALPGWWDDDPRDSSTFWLKRTPGGVPILPLDPTWMERWARMQMGGGQRVPAVIVRKREGHLRSTPERRTAEDWNKAVQAFVRNCSGEARMLAVYLSQGTFTLPLVRLIQAVKLGRASSHTQVAEILLSGLVQRTTPSVETVPHEWVEYQFHPLAAKQLSRGLRGSDARDISKALKQHIERYWGKPVDFRALVYDPKGLLAIPRWAQPFAQLGRSLVGLLQEPDSPESIPEHFSGATVPLYCSGTPALSVWQSALHEVLSRLPENQDSMFRGIAVTALDPAMQATVQVLSHFDMTGGFDAPFVGRSVLSTKGEEFEATAEDDPQSFVPPPSLESNRTECARLATQIAYDSVTDPDRAAILKEEFAAGTCDPRWAECLAVYDQYRPPAKAQPYINHQSIDDFVLEKCFPDQATIALIGNWGTGTNPALILLRHIARNFQPDVLLHLGNIYYSGLPSECKMHFTDLIDQTWPDDARYMKPLVFTLAGNHDRYAGSNGGYYDLIRGLNRAHGKPQPNSYFAVRNNFWQFLALDTAYEDVGQMAFGGSPGPTKLVDQEVPWHWDKIKNDGANVDRSINPSGSRGTVVLSHHQLYSFHGVGRNANGRQLAVNPHLVDQFGGVFDLIDLWLWGHENALYIFEPYANGSDQPLPKGRCIGASAIPNFLAQRGTPDPQLVLPPGITRPPTLIPNTELDHNGTVFNSCYAILRLDGPKMSIDYYQVNSSDATSGNPPPLGQPLFSEVLEAKKRNW